MIRRSAPIAALALALTAIATACSSNSSNNATPSTTGAVSVTARVTAANTQSSASIRTEDLEHSAPVQQALSATGGEYMQSEVIYGDLTGDGAEEAVVPISSGGTLGDIAYVVLTPSVAGVTQIFASPQDAQSEGGVSVSVEGGKLVETRPVYGPTDPNCCPSQLKTTTYAWDGSKFAQESTSTSPSPAGGVKSTPAAGAPQ